MNGLWMQWRGSENVAFFVVLAEVETERFHFRRGPESDDRFQDEAPSGLVGTQEWSEGGYPYFQTSCLPFRSPLPQ